MIEASVILDGVRVNYRRFGHGPDVVFVHGWSSSGRMWVHLRPWLEAHYRCWLLDLPGCGDSEKPEAGWYSIPQYTALLRAFTQVLGLGRVHLVGHSMGGLVALDTAATHPAWLAKLFVINPVVSGQATARPFVQFKPNRAVMAWMLQMSPKVVEPLLARGEKLHPGVKFLRRRNEDFNKGTLDAMWDTGVATVTYSVVARLPYIQAPTLVLLGNRDVTASNREGRMAARLIPQARLVVLATGHHPTDDKPTVTTDLMREFFE